MGAGIYAAPNLTRLLTRWGLDSAVRPLADPLERIDLRRWEKGEILGVAPLMPEIEQRHGAPQYVVHRADVHRVLMDYASKHTQLRVNSIVVDVDPDRSVVTLKSGQQLRASLIIGADG